MSAWKKVRIFSNYPFFQLSSSKSSLSFRLTSFSKIKLQGKEVVITQQTE